jgi:hypothetical protein
MMMAATMVDEMAVEKVVMMVVSWAVPMVVTMVDEMAVG